MGWRQTDYYIEEDGVMKRLYTSASIDLAPSAPPRESDGKYCPQGGAGKADKALEKSIPKKGK